MSFCPKCDDKKHAKVDKLKKRTEANMPEEDDDDEGHVQLNPAQNHNRFALPPSRIAAVQKIPNFDQKEEVQVRFKPPTRGKYAYYLHLRNDSYIGCDTEAEFKLEVFKPKEGVKKEKEDEGLDDDPVDEPDTKEPEVKWYYLGASSFLEMILNVVVLIVLAFFFVNFLQTRGYWQKYVQPSLDRLHTLWMPIWRKIHPVVGFIYDPLVSTISNFVSYLAEKLTAPAPPVPLKTET